MRRSTNINLTKKDSIKELDNPLDQLIKNLQKEIVDKKDIIEELEREKFVLINKNEKLNQNYVKKQIEQTRQEKDFNKLKEKFNDEKNKLKNKVNEIYYLSDYFLEFSNYYNNLLYDILIFNNNISKKIILGEDLNYNELWINFDKKFKIPNINKINFKNFNLKYQKASKILHNNIKHIFDSMKKNEFTFGYQEIGKFFKTHKNQRLVIDFFNLNKNKSIKKSNDLNESVQPEELKIQLDDISCLKVNDNININDFDDSKMNFNLDDILIHNKSNKKDYLKSYEEIIDILTLNINENNYNEHNLLFLCEKSNKLIQLIEEKIILNNNILKEINDIKIKISKIQKFKEDNENNVNKFNFYKEEYYEKNKEYEQLKIKFEENENNLKNFQNKYNEENEKLKNINQLNIKIKSEIELLSNKINQTNLNIKEKQLENNNLSEKIKLSKINIEEYIEKKNKNQQEIDNLKNCYFKLKNELNDIEQEVNNLSDNINIENNKLKEINLEIDTNKNKIDNYNDNINKLKIEYKNQKNNLLDIKENILNYDLEIENNIKINQNLNKLIISEKNNLNDLKQKNSKINNENKILNEEIIIIKKNLEILKERDNFKECEFILNIENLIKVDDKSEKLDNINNDNKIILDEVNKKLNEINQKIKKKQMEKIKLEVEINSKNEFLEKLEKEYKLLENQLNNLKIKYKNIDEKNNNILGLQDKIKVVTQNILNINLNENTVNINKFSNNLKEIYDLLRTELEEKKSTYEKEENLSKTSTNFINDLNEVKEEFKIRKNSNDKTSPISEKNKLRNTSTVNIEPYKEKEILSNHFKKKSEKNFFFPIDKSSCDIVKDNKFLNTNWNIIMKNLSKIVSLLLKSSSMMANNLSLIISQIMKNDKNFQKLKTLIIKFLNESFERHRNFLNETYFYRNEKDININNLFKCIETLSQISSLESNSQENISNKLKNYFKNGKI